MPIVQSKQFGMSQPNVRHKVESYTYSYKQDCLMYLFRCSNAFGVQYPQHSCPAAVSKIVTLHSQLVTLTKQSISYLKKGNTAQQLLCLVHSPAKSMTNADLSASISASLRAASAASGSKSSSSLASSQDRLRRFVDATAAPSSPVSLAA